MQMRTQQKTIIAVTHDVEFVAECNPRVLLMREGKVIADGIATRILTDPEILTQASIVPPQIAQIFLELPGLNLQKDIIDVYEAARILQKILEKRGR
jgi:energy-coupling factor transport system ATP-binding protein